MRWVVYLLLLVFTIGGFWYAWKHTLGEDEILEEWINDD